MNYFDNSYFYENQIPYRNYPKTIIFPRFNKTTNRNLGINLTKIIDTTQKGINTINQIVPLYKQVSPIIKQVSNFTRSISSFVFKRNTRNQNDYVINEKKSSTTSTNYRTQNNENNPFFN